DVGDDRRPGEGGQFGVVIGSNFGRAQGGVVGFYFGDRHGRERHGGVPARIVLAADAERQGTAKLGIGAVQRNGGIVEIGVQRERVRDAVCQDTVEVTRGIGVDVVVNIGDVNPSAGGRVADN